MFNIVLVAAGDPAEHRQRDPARGQHRLPRCTWSSRSASRWTTGCCAAPASTITSTPTCGATRRGRRFVAAAAPDPRAPVRVHDRRRPRLRRRRLAARRLAGVRLARPPGLPTAVRRRFAAAQQRAPADAPGQRSLNLSNAVAVAVFEAWRQNGYAGGGLDRRSAALGSGVAPQQQLERLRRRRAGRPAPAPPRRRSASRRRARAARCSTIGALRTPSATWPSSARMRPSGMPSARRRPTVRLRDRSPVAVSTRSPRPDRPMKVSRVARRGRRRGASSRPGRA